MSAHRYNVGDLVRLQSAATVLKDEGAADVISLKRPKGIYEIIGLLPAVSHREPQYRVWHPGGQELVVYESEMDLVTYAQPPR